ncbi:hypothetical protein SOVF_092850 [Spinacia oleracea]|nr:hypothetical protein SOVF_092850 [Spinacia oleracea]
MKEIPLPDLEGEEPEEVLEYSTGQFRVAKTDSADVLPKVVFVLQLCSLAAVCCRVMLLVVYCSYCFCWLCSVWFLQLMCSLRVASSSLTAAIFLVGYWSCCDMC